MIGALLFIPSAALAATLDGRLTRRGFADVTPAQRGVMRVLSPQGDRVTDLARKAGIAKQSMGYLVSRLEASGYVERADHPADRRASLVRRTEKGWRFSRAAAESVAEVEAEWTRMIGRAKMARLKQTLGDLVAALGHQFEGSLADYATRAPGHPRQRVRLRLSPARSNE